MFKEERKGGPIVKNLSANSKDTGSIPTLQRFHMSWGKGGPAFRAQTATREVTTTHTARKSSLRSQQLEKARAQQLRPSVAKSK